MTQNSRGDDRRVILSETLFVLGGSLLLSAVMHAVYLIIGRWTLGVLWGSLVTVAATTANFYAMCRTLQNAVEAGLTQEQIKGRMKISQGLRLLVLALVIGGCAYLSTVTDPPVFDLWALLIPLFFGRVTLSVRSLWLRRADDGAAAPAVSDDAPGDEKQKEPEPDPDDILPPFLKKGPAWEEPDEAADSRPAPDPADADGKEEHEDRKN